MDSHPASPSRSSSSSSSASENAPVTYGQLTNMFHTFAQHQQEQIQQLMNSLTSNYNTMSDASMAAASAQPANNPIFNPGPSSSSPAASLPAKVKIAAPSNFSGNNREINVDSWLFEMTQYLDTCGVADASRIQVARNYLKQTAQQWWFSQNQKPADQRPSTWAAFATALRQRFQPVAASLAARSQLRTLSQDKLSLSEYVSRFYSLLSLITDMSEADQIEYFVSGLRPSIQRDVVIQDPRTLQDAMIKAQKIESLNQLQSRRSAHATSPSSNFSPFYSAPSSSAPSASIDPMELGNVNVIAETDEKEPEDLDEMDAEYERYLQVGDEYERIENDHGEDENPTMQLQAIQPRASNPSRAPFLSREEFTRCMNEGLCLRCKKPGHVARNCSLPPRQPNQHRRPNPQFQYPSSSRRNFGQKNRNFQ